MPQLYLSIIALLFLCLPNSVAAQTFRGQINAISFYIDIKDRKAYTDEQGRMSIDSTRVKAIGNFKICGDTIISSHFHLESERNGKSIHIGNKAYYKSARKPGYFQFKMQSRELFLNAKKEDWKRTRGKYKKDGLEWYLEDSNKPYVQYFATVDTTMQFPNQFALGGTFANLFHYNGIRTMDGFRYKDQYMIRWLEYQVKEDLVCKDFMNDFWVDKKAEIDWDKELQAAQTSKVIIPEAERRVLPPAEFEDEFGTPVFLDQFFGKYVYLDFWASWCAPCRAEMPYTKTIRDKYQKKDLEVISITLDKAAALPKWREMIEKLEMDWHNWHLKYDFGSSLAQALEIKGIPRYILLDPEGKIINDRAPRPSNARLIEFLDKVLDQKRD
ncbi:MAG: TlpA disulfide reductase family protein [Bacteroidota bacterium]